MHAAAIGVPPAVEGFGGTPPPARPSPGLPLPEAHVFANPCCAHSASTFRTIPRTLRAGVPLLATIAVLAVATSLAQERRERFRPVARDMANTPEAPPADGRLVLIGNRSYNEEQLRVPLADSLKEIESGGLTRPRADDAAYYLGIYYRKQGFPQADVRWEIRGSRLVLKINEGPRTYLRNIRFVGNRSQSSEVLYEYMIGETGERLLRQPEKFPFVEADIQTGVARLRGLYENDGRLDAKIADAEIAYSGNRTSVDVTVRIEEGPKYLFGQVNFIGATMFDRARLIDALGNPSGEEPSKAADAPPPPKPLDEPFTTQRANTMQHNLLYFFKLQGYYAAKVEVKADPKAARVQRDGTRRVPITFTVKSGALYRFDGITVTGLERVKPKFMEARFRPLRGKVYDPRKLDERYRQVLRTGLFRNLRMSTVPLPTNEVRIDLKAEEAKAKEIGFSIGFSSYEGAMVGLRLADRNFMGNGRPLSLDIDYSTRSMRAELLYVDPWWYDTDFALRARLFVQDRTEVGYSFQQAGFRADVTRKVTKFIELGIFAEAKNVNIIESSIEPQFLGPTSYQIGTLGLTQAFDFRDNPVNPSRGWIIGLGLDADTIAGEVAFGRATARLSYYIPIQKKYLLALGARGGLIYPLSEVPIPERFFSGGSTTVRSFRERRLGPMDKGGNPIGGEAFTVFNAEFVIPVKDALSAALFVDAGNVRSGIEEAGLEELRYAIGVGLRYRLPIGPVRLDVGINPNPKDAEDWGAVHFSFGFAF
jgi:outer membrane protein insertion porin family